MGCKQSKAVRVQPAGDKEVKNNLTEGKSGDKTKRKGTKDNRKDRRGSRDSLDAESLGSEDRQGSAGSKKSHDSGLDLGEDNQGFITEYSDPDKRRAVEEGFVERDDLELGVTGTQLPTRNSAKDKARMEESLIMQKLREEGLISKTTSEKKGGVSFDIVDMATGSKMPALPPIKLAKLERRRKKRKSLTEEEIQQKLERAEQRRKRKEQARLEKIKDMDKADQTAALESFQDYVKKKEEQSVQRMESVQDNREKRLREIKEKQLARERKREEVRRRKREQKERELAQTENGEIVMDPSELVDREETPMVPE